MFDSDPFFFYVIVAVSLLATELLVFQLSVFWLLFIGLGALVAALTAWFVPDASWLLTTSVFIIASAVISLLLYRPLKKWQNKPSIIAGNDAVGQSVKVLSLITKDQAGIVTWSGTDWHADLAAGSSDLEPGNTAKIVSMEGIRLTVTKS